MSPPEIINKAHVFALLADNLLTNSGELLKLVIEVGRTVGYAATNLKLVTSELYNVSCGATIGSGVTKAQINQNVVDTANHVVQLSAQASLNIRRIIGWTDHPYLKERRNEETTLIGTEHALTEVLYEMTALACSSVNENSCTDVCRRIEVMANAAKKNVKTATATAVAVDAVGAMAIKISRTKKNH